LTHTATDARYGTITITTTAPDQGDSWSWLTLAAYTQLRLARTLTEDLWGQGPGTLSSHLRVFGGGYTWIT
jgi:hypothetical protein